MANLPNNPFAELRNLEARVDQRLDMLGRAETNLKALLDSLRTQVASAFPVVDQLTKLVPIAKQSAAEAAALPNVGEVADVISSGVDRAKAELEAAAGPLREKLIEDLRAVVQVAKSTLATAEIAKPAREDLDLLAAAFREEARETLDAVRERLADQIDLIPADTKIRVEPILNEIDASRRAAEGAVKAAADAAQADMRRRADQLRQSIDDISVVLEQRLTQRTSALHQRAEAAMNALKPAMDERLAALLVAVDETILARERELISKIDAYPQRLDRQLADAEAMLMDRLGRTERHATDMTAYLEQKLTARVDELVARLRLKLQQELTQVAGTPTPEARTPAAAASTTPSPFAIDRPNLEATLYVGARRPNLNPAA